MKDEKYILEHKFILLLTKTYVNDEELKELKKLFNCRLNWIYIIGQIDFHKISGLVWKNIKKLILSNPENSFVCSHLINTLEMKYQYQGIRAKKQLTIINDIVNQFKNNNIKCALLKGIPLSIMSYQDISVRLSNDIDILVRTKDLEKVNSILKGMGFVQGEYDFYKNRINTADRSSTILSSLVSHEVYPYTKIVNDILDYTQVDIQFSIELLTGNRTDEIVEDILNDINEIKIRNYEIPSLSIEHMLMMVCIHFYRESIYIKEIDKYKDLILLKLCDINNLLCNPNLGVSYFVTLVHKYNVEKDIYFAVYHMLSIYDSIVGKQILNYLNVNEKKYLNQVFGEDKKVYRWTNSIEDRIFDINRKHKLVLDEW